MKKTHVDEKPVIIFTVLDVDDGSYKLGLHMEALGKGNKMCTKNGGKITVLLT
jgi:hypothetical protein